MTAKVGDIVKIVDPDDYQIDGFPYSTVGLLVRIEEKSPGGWKILLVTAATAAYTMGRFCLG